MIIVNDLLKTDPFRSSKQDRYYISENVFYSEVYARPKTAFLREMEQNITEGNSLFRLLNIDGYAGCGKTLFAHYLIHKYGFDDEFFYEFDQGEGKNYSLDHVKEKMIELLSRQMAVDMLGDKQVLQKFFDFGRNSFNHETEYQLFGKLFYDEPCVLDECLKGEFEEPEPVAATIDRFSELLKSVSENANNGDAIKFLLLCDYFWRISKAIVHKYALEDKVIFCLMDNLDNLNQEAVVELYVNVREMVRNFSVQRISDHRNGVGADDIPSYKFVYLLPTREVTMRNLRYGLRQRKDSETPDDRGRIFRMDLNDNNVSLHQIIKKRKDYWSQIDATKKEVDKIKEIETLMRMPYVHGPFADLLNGNYLYCIDRIIDLFLLKGNKENDLMLEVLNLHQQTYNSNDYRGCAGEGIRGIILRMLLELFKERDVYEGVTDKNQANQFNVNGKLGLAPLDLEALENSGTEKSVSISRLLMTFIQSSEEGGTSLVDIFKCFSNMNMDCREICRSLYALSENTRDVWRRLIVFETNSPASVDDLYQQFTLFTSNKPDSISTSMEICLAGSTYVKSVVPHFEFYLSRLTARNSLKEFPPLFCKASSRLRGTQRLCFSSIEKVLESVEYRAEELYEFDINFIQWCNDPAYISRMFLNNESIPNAQQTHLSRLIFSHISYIERYRRYLLFKLNNGAGENLSKELIEVNERFVSYIVRYLALFNYSTVEKAMRNRISNSFLTEKYFSQAKTRKTCNDIVDFACKCESDGGYRNSVKQINTGYIRQAVVQEKLLERIQFICSFQYAKISKIELSDDKDGFAV